MDSTSQTNQTSFLQRLLNDDGPMRLVRLLFLLVPCFTLLYFLVLPLEWNQQLFVSIALVAGIVVMNRLFKGHTATLVIVCISLFCSARYICYRFTNTFGIGAESGAQPRAIDMIFMLILLSAELYAFIILVLGYIQTVRPLERKPVPLPEDPNEWPTVDIFIPSYNESLSIVRYTVWAAMNIDWPADRYKVYILDDGRREEFRKFAEESGCGYIVRNNNAHAKAGNINAALTKTHGEFVAIFDCDHVPTRSFLQMTMGWFRKDTKLGMLQTPHYFYSPDPFERNLQQFRTIPNEGELFYGLVQDGNDLWNATFFCGSCAVLRRTAIEEIGGIAVETVTEDAHTSLRMQIRGWNTAYINIPQAAGLATDSLSGHVGQRIRWARGMIQILRLDNPLLQKGLKPLQRLCYFNAMVHFLYAVPRLIFLTSPLIYLLLGHLNIRGYSLTIFAYALPHIILSNLTNSRIQGRYRHSFWNEVYEAVLSPYILAPTMLALVNPKLGKFNVTAKGGLVPESYFDYAIARPYMILLFLNLAGLVAAVPRIIWWDSDHPGTIIMNAIWTLYNVVIMGVSCAVAFETKQRRTHVRVDAQIPVLVRLEDNRIIQGDTLDMSNGGVAVRVPRGTDVKPNEPVHIRFGVLGTKQEIPAVSVGNEGTRLRLEFDALNLPQEEELTRVLYSRADSWLHSAENRPLDKPLRSLFLLMRLSVKGIAMALQNLTPKRKQQPKEEEDDKPTATKQPSAAGTALLLIFGLGLLAWPGESAARDKSANQKAPVAGATEHTKQGSETFHVIRNLGNLGEKNAISLQGPQATHTLKFALPSSQVATTAILHLRYHLASQLDEQKTHLVLAVNGMSAGTVPLVHSQDSRSAAEATINLPADDLLTDNSLEIKLESACFGPCVPAAVLTTIEPTSELELSGQRIALQSSVAELPAPFLDPSMQNAVISFAFPASPDPKILQAAGILASWFGSAADYRGVRFSAAVNHIPEDNAIIVATANSLPASLGLSQISKPMIAFRQNPSDSYSKVLVITGADEEQVLRAATGLALGRTTQTDVDTLEPASNVFPLPRKENDAPRWLPTNDVTTLGDMFSPEQLHMSGFGWQNLYFRLPPDLYYGNRGSVPLHLNFRVDGIPVGLANELNIYLNGTPVGRIQVSSDTSLIQHANVILPVSAIKAFANVLMLNWKAPGAGAAVSQSSADPQLQIMRNSTLEFEGIAHFMDMPKLERFAEAGYPFTRFADLDHTAVVLGNTSSTGEIGSFLTMMGYFGAQTGFPAIRVTVAYLGAIESVERKDILAFETYADNAVLKRIGKDAPVTVEHNGVRLTGNDKWWMDLRRSAWNPEGRTRQSLADLLEADPGPQGVVAGFESPFHNGSSVVDIIGQDDKSLETLTAQLAGIDRVGAIYGSVSVFYNGRFESLYLTRDDFQIGTLPPYQAANLWFIRRVYLLPLLIIFLCGLPVIWMVPQIERQVRSRLEPKA